MASTDINPSPDRQVFMSRDRNRRIVRVPLREGLGHNVDQLVQSLPRLAYEFKDNYLVVDEAVRERDRRFFEEHAGALNFKRNGDGEWTGDLEGRIRPNEPSEVWLRNHDTFGEPGGFTEIEYAEADSGPIRAEIGKAILHEDMPALLELYEAEENGHGRQGVLDDIKEAIETLDARGVGAAG